MGFGVWGLGFGVWGLGLGVGGLGSGFGVGGLGFGVWGLGFGVWGLGFGVWGLGFGVWGLGFGVWGNPNPNTLDPTRPQPHGRAWGRGGQSPVMSSPGHVASRGLAVLSRAGSGFIGRRGRAAVAIESYATAALVSRPGQEEPRREESPYVGFEPAASDVWGPRV